MMSTMIRVPLVRYYQAQSQVLTGSAFLLLWCRAQGQQHGLHSGTVQIPCRAMPAYIGITQQQAGRWYILSFATLQVQGNMRLTGAFYDLNNDPGLSGQILTSTASGTDWVTSLSPTGSGFANKVAIWTGSGTVSYNNNFHFDNTNTRLGIGTSAPYCKLEVQETASPCAILGDNTYNADGAAGIRGESDAINNASNHVAGVIGYSYGSGTTKFLWCCSS